MSIFEGHGWHEGEKKMHRLTRVPEGDNPTVPGLYSFTANVLQTSPLLAIGTLDEQKRPWTTILAGPPSFARPLGASMVGVRADVDAKFDPVIDALLPRERRVEKVVKYDGEGKMMAGLAIDLMTRRRVKLAGKMVAGAVEEAAEGEASTGTGEIQMAVRIDQSMGNCPKYLNKKKIELKPGTPSVVSEGPQLVPEAIKLINKADMIFISTSDGEDDMDTNHRGGPDGFVRVTSNSVSGAEIIYPEYSGNRLYQTLGNLQTTPKAGVVIPDFDTGDVLYFTGDTEVLIGKDAAAILPQTNLAVKIKITSARFVKEGLPFRGIAGEMSPYNPKVRLLASESNFVGTLMQTTADGTSSNSAKLLEAVDITPTVSRYRFAITNPTNYRPGQWVALDLSDELDMGYSHMRDDDPLSINDDYIRTFTVSSQPKRPVSSDAIGPEDEFEITVRTHGPVTKFLRTRHGRERLEIPLKGFGGDFVIESSKEGLTPFIAGGVGITPLLCQLHTIDQNSLRLFWIVQAADIAFVREILTKYPDVAKHATIFLTGDVGAAEAAGEVDGLRGLGSVVRTRRPGKEDFETGHAEKWYLCAGNPLKGKLLEWLNGRKVVFENFDY